jgi:Na+-translocating ferredoxin:NAD+ oxidoreductase RnfD subunit
MKLIWERTPTWTDPRVPFLVLLGTYLVVGVTLLGFNRTPIQILITITAACLLDMGLHYAYKRQLLFPLSAAITGASLGILMNYAHNPWLSLVPVFFAISSKYILTYNGRHVFNPSLFGIVISLLISDGMISVAPAYQWGSSPTIVLFIVTAALVFFVFRIRRNTLILSFLILYIIALAFRAWLTRWHVPPETLMLGMIASPAFYLFTFFMITDPATSPHSKTAQVLMALFIVLVDLWLHKYQSYSTLFFAGFAYFLVRFIYLHLHKIQSRWKDRLKFGLMRLPLPGLIAILAWQIHQQWIGNHVTDPPDFQFTTISSETAGIRSRSGNILQLVDSRIAHIGKWLLSIGDAVVVADVNNDGLPDIFLTYPLKATQDRAALYLNRGGFKFERVPLPVLQTLVSDPVKHGLASGALWFDYDNDGDKDLLVLLSFGYPRLLQNRWIEEAKLEFLDISDQLGIQAYITSLSANAIDIDRDGRLDIVLGNAMNPFLADYPKPTRFNIFNLPDPAYSGDRRMFNFMHRSWDNANNGGENIVYMNRTGGFEQHASAEFGLTGSRWTMDIGTADINGDGWTDLYVANDFGPDAMYINTTQGRFEEVRGTLNGSIGRDIYKGMNASLGDIDNNGFADVYVSNVHEKLQAEGSMLWMNDGSIDQNGDAAFRDEAMARNAINEKRFGWGAAMGDLDRDGLLDIVQANGMVDDSYDKRFEDCPDYWYWNAKIALTSPDIHGYADKWADLRGYCIFPNEKNRVYLNRGDYFVDVATPTGIDEPGNSRGVALADFDNDGDLDMLISHQFLPVSIYRNDAMSKTWLGLSLQGNASGCNRDAIGTRVVLETSDGRLNQVREVQAANGFSSQSDMRLIFGLGHYKGDIDVKIHWCGAEVAEQLRLTPMKYHRIVQQKTL